MRVMDKKLKEKLKKLKAIMDDTKASQGEIENASLLMQKLLMKHNLSEADLELSQSDVEDIGVDTSSSKNEGRWELHLAYVVAKNNLGSMYFTRLGAASNRGIIHILGTEENVELIKEQIQILLIKFRELARCEVKIAKREAIDKFNPNKWKRDYLMGCINGLRQKYESQKSVYGTTSGEYGLMVIKHNTIIEDYVKEHLNLGKGKRSKLNVNTSAYRAGMAAGNRTSTQRAIR